jgi:hypothetical protein
LYMSAGNLRRRHVSSDTGSHAFFNFRREADNAAC